MTATRIHTSLGSVSAVENQVLCVPRVSSGLDPYLPVLATYMQSTILPENHVLIQVDRFGFSANNVTYQALGESPHFRCVAYTQLYRNVTHYSSTKVL